MIEFIKLLLLYMSDGALSKKPHYDINKADMFFEKYKSNHNKTYDEKECDMRFDIFKDNLRKINELNAMYDNMTFGVNQYTDLTSDEFLGRYTGFAAIGDNLTDSAPPDANMTDSPATLDWRTKGVVGKIKDQQSCGSCAVFSAIGNIESQYAIEHGEVISLSEQQGLDCNSQGSCSGGWPHDVMNALAKQGGCMKEEDYPYTAEKGQCNTDTSRIAVKVLSGQQWTNNDDDTLKSYVSNLGPLSVSLVASESFQHYRSGVFTANDCTGDQNHAVVIVGYVIPMCNNRKDIGCYADNTEGYWIIKNSWGSNWGERGYMRMAFGYCDIGTYYAASSKVQ